MLSDICEAGAANSSAESFSLDAALEEPRYKSCAPPLRGLAGTTPGLAKVELAGSKQGHGILNCAGPLTSTKMR